MLNFIFGRANSGKSHITYERIAELFEKGKKSVLIVPEQSSFESERALLSRTGGKTGERAEVLTFSRLAEIALRGTGGAPRMPIDNSGRLVVMSEAMRMVKPSLKYYLGNISGVDFIRTMTRTIAELKQSGLVPSDLIELSNSENNDTFKNKLHDFAVIMGEYDQMIDEKYADTDDELTKLAEMLFEFPFFDNTYVFFDAFDGFTGQQFKVIERIFAQTQNITFTLPCDGLEDDTAGLGVFANVKKGARKIIKIAASQGVKLGERTTLPKSFFESDALTRLEKGFSFGAEISGEDLDGVHVCEVENIYDEADYAAYKIHKMVREMQEVRYRDFVVIARDLSLYQDALTIAAKKYDLPIFMDDKMPASQAALMIFVRNVISAAMKFATSDILRMLKTGILDISLDDINEIENYVYIWSISGDEWKGPFTRNPEGLLEGEMSSDMRDKLAHLDEIRMRIITPLISLANALSTKNTLKISRGLFNYLDIVNVKINLKRLTNMLEKSGDNEGANIHKQSYDVLVSVVSQLAVSCPSEITAARYYELFNMMISEQTIGVVPQMLDCVIAGSAGKIRAGRPRYTFLIGFNQGSFPRVNPMGLITLSERRKLCDNGIEINDCRLENAVDESYLLYRTLFSCFSGLFISYCRCTPSGEATPPSALLKKITDLLNGLKTLILSDSKLLQPDMLECEIPALGALARHWDDTDILAGSLKKYFSIYGTNVPLWNMLQLAANRIPCGEELLNKKTAAKLFSENISLSASRADTFFKCKFSYFCKYGLKLKPLKKAEFNILKRGTAVHYVLERLIGKYKEKISTLSRDEREKDICKFMQEYMMLMIGEVPSDAYTKYLMQSVTELLFELGERLSNEFSVCDFIPEYCELKIGYDGSLVDAFSLPLKYGSISINGSVDRVDTLRDGNKLIFRVVDYKTGARAFALPDILHGLNMQMLIYLLALRRNGIKGREDLQMIPAGILYMISKRAIAKGDETIQDALKEVRANGLVTNDIYTLLAMNKNISNDPVNIFAPFTLTKSGAISSRSKTASFEEFELILSHVEKQLIKMGNELHDGKITVSPQNGKGVDACKYCEYASACTKESNFANKEVPPMSDSEVFDKLREEASENGL